MKYYTEVRHALNYKGKLIKTITASYGAIRSMDDAVLLVRKKVELEINRLKKDGC